MTDANKIAYAKRYLGRTKSLAELKTLADQVASAILSGKTRIAVTGIVIEGGMTTGQIEFECAIVGQACEELIAALDSTVAPQYRQLGSVVVFR